MAIRIFRSLKNLLQGRKIEESTQEGLIDSEARELLELAMKDEDLVREIDKDILGATGLHNEFKIKQDENEAYFKGTQLDNRYFGYELPTAENLLYMALETKLSIITAKRRDPVVLASQNDDESKEVANLTEQFLTWKWNEQDMNLKFEDFARHCELNYIGVLKIRFDVDKDDFEIKVIRPQRIIIDQYAEDEYDAKFIAEIKEDALGNICEMFPKAKSKLIAQYGGALGSRLKYLEYWTNEFVIWKVGSIIIDKKKNPNWNWDETPDKREKNLKKIKEQWKTKIKTEKLENLLLNYFNEPRKPYIIASLKNLGNSIYGDTTDFEQGKIVQDFVNRRKRQIDRAAQHSIGREVYSGSFLDKNEAKKAWQNPNAAVWLRAGKAGDAVSIIQPTPVSPILFEDLKDSKIALDNIMGTHGTTRGEQEPNETARGRTILREGDFGRIDLAVRRLDKKLELLYAWMLQMVKVFYNNTHFVKIIGAESSIKYLQFSQNDVNDGMEIMVKSEMTVDKATQRQTADQRMSAGLIDPLTYFEAMDEPNPKEKAKRYILYTQDPRLYLAEVVQAGETIEGTTVEPIMRAQQEQGKLEIGQDVPPFEGATKEHLQEHINFGQSAKFSKMEDIIKQNFLNHVRAENDLVKGTAQSNK